MIAVEPQPLTPQEFHDLRLRGDWTLKELGLAMGVHWTTLWRYEQGARGIPLRVGHLLQQLVREAEARDVDV